MSQEGRDRRRHSDEDKDQNLKEAKRPKLDSSPSETEDPLYGILMAKQDELVNKFRVQTIRKVKHVRTLDGTSVPMVIEERRLFPGAEHFDNANFSFQIGGLNQREATPMQVDEEASRQASPLADGSSQDKVLPLIQTLTLDSQPSSSNIKNPSQQHSEDLRKRNSSKTSDVECKDETKENAPVPVPSTNPKAKSSLRRAVSEGQLLITDFLERGVGKKLPFPKDAAPMELDHQLPSTSRAAAANPKQGTLNDDDISDDSDVELLDIPTSNDIPGVGLQPQTVYRFAMGIKCPFTPCRFVCKQITNFKTHIYKFHGLEIGLESDLLHQNSGELLTETNVLEEFQKYVQYEKKFEVIKDENQVIIFDRERKTPVVAFYSCVKQDRRRALDISRAKLTSEDSLGDDQMKKSEISTLDGSLQCGHLIPRIAVCGKKINALNTDKIKTSSGTEIYPNVSPMYEKVNNGCWSASELFSQYLVNLGGWERTLILCGPILNRNKSKRGQEKIPEAFFKIIVMESSSRGRRSISFIVDNKPNNEDYIFNCLASVEKIEPMIDVSFTKLLKDIVPTTSINPDIIRKCPVLRCKDDPAIKHQFYGDHVRSHFPDTCSICDGAFESPRQLLNHQAIHLEKVASYPCPISGCETLEYPTIEARAMHFIKVHKLTDAPFQCRKCNECFASKYNYDTHWLKCWDKSEAEYDSFYDPEPLSKPLRAIQEDKPICKCGMAFKNYRSLANHRRNGCKPLTFLEQASKTVVTRLLKDPGHIVNRNQQLKCPRKKCSDLKFATFEDFQAHWIKSSQHRAKFPAPNGDVDLNAYIKETVKLHDSLRYGARPRRFSI